LNTAISGIGVFYPDKRSTQRVGIIPDVEIVPTIEGIRDGRDEALEEAIRRIRTGEPTSSNSAAQVCLRNTMIRRELWQMRV